MCAFVDFTLTQRCNNDTGNSEKTKNTLTIYRNIFFRWIYFSDRGYWQGSNFDDAGLVPGMQNFVLQFVSKKMRSQSNDDDCQCDSRRQHHSSAKDSRRKKKNYSRRDSDMQTATMILQTIGVNIILKTCLFFPLVSAVESFKFDTTGDVTNYKLRPAGHLPTKMFNVQHESEWHLL